MQNVLLRVDAGLEVGLGHLHRCLSLANALAQKGSTSHFVIPESAAIGSRITCDGITVDEIPSDSSLETDLNITLNCARRVRARVVVVDSCVVDRDYLWKLRRAGHYVVGHYVVSIDDLAEMIFPSQLIVNGNVYAQELFYESASGDTRFLLGTEYVMLRPEFWNVPSRAVRDNIRRVLLTVGGTDQQNLMPKLLSLMDDLPGDFGVIAILGPFFENCREVEMAKRHSKRSVQLIYAPESVGSIMLDVLRWHYRWPQISINMYVPCLKLVSSPWENIAAILS
jgi:spore coat polysaccharide biosynthesis predicted glycosyltransferase SpsG